MQLTPRVLGALAVAGALAAAPAATVTAGAQVTPGGSAPASTALPPPAAAEILVDVDTGKVLYEQDAHTPLPPGSLTKTLTAMIAADWLAPGSSVPADQVAFNAYPDKVGMKPGQQWPLSITLHALITDSANDAAYALADDIGGSLAGFATVMSRAAAQIGMSDHPVLEDPAGLDGTEGFDGGNRISAWDLAIAGRDMMANPQLAAIAGQRTFDFEGPDHIAYHIVSRNLNFLLTYPGAIGVKTGFTDRAGYCDMEEAERGGRHMLAVVLHSTNPDAAAASLISNGFALAADREAPDAPVLPAVTEPQPHPPAPAPTTGAPNTGTPASGAPTVPARDPVAAAATPPTRQGSGPDRLVEGAAALTAAVGIFLLGRRAARRPGPRHRRR